MKSIKPLHEVDYSTVRSSIILYDLTTIVEELIYNSLDASATKISAFVGINAGFVKVVDDGSGITREGLVLLGERYATSKIYSSGDTVDATGSFGFRGEALCSISDVSLLEIVTKTQGIPNGYRKIMKGCKCLHLGIDDDRKTVGTTVVVRDLFYNQPVRRKQMQFSPKKVLQSVKKSVLRIALVHSEVCFKLVDIESEEELLFTHPSHSPLSLLKSSFGIEIFNSLSDFNFSDGILKLSGYISGSCDAVPAKAIQYVYINSRFMSKGPIHKLLVQLASSFSHHMDSWKLNDRSDNRKRSRSQAYPSFILNLRCPTSHYDLILEPSRTSVEFKDWARILAFIKKGITQFWSGKTGCGNHVAVGSVEDETWEVNNTVSVNELFQKSQITEKSRMIHHQWASSIGHPSSAKILNLKNEDDDIFSGEMHVKVAESKKVQTEMGFYHPRDYSFTLLAESSSEHASLSDAASEKHSQLQDDDFFSADYKLLKTNTTGSDNYSEDNQSTVNALVNDGFEFYSMTGVTRNSFKGPFLQSCSLSGALSPDGALFQHDKEFEFQIQEPRRGQCNSDDGIDVADYDDKRFSMDFWEDSKTTDNELNIHMRAEGFSESSLSFEGECIDRENDIPSALPAEFRKSGFMRESLDSGWQPRKRVRFSVGCWDDEHFTLENALGENLRSSSRATYGDLTRRDAKNAEDIFYLREQDNITYDVDWSSLDWWDEHDRNDSSVSFQRIHLPNRVAKNETCKNHQVDNVSEQYNVRTRRSKRGFSAPPFYKNKKKFSSPKMYFTKELEKSSGKMVHEESTTLPVYAEEDSNLKHPGEYSAMHHRSSSSDLTKDLFVCSRMEKGCALDLTPEREIFNHPKFLHVHNADLVKEDCNLKHLGESSGMCHPCSNSDLSKDTSTGYSPICRLETESMLDIMPKKQNIDMPKFSHVCDTDLVKDADFMGTQDLTAPGIKWNNYPQSTNADDASESHGKCSILDISSGILHLAGDSLVPDSINKSCLEDAQVLAQVDKKFIPIVARGILAIIDQHAADERIRLEELRQKVLSGEGKKITYLDTEKELVLPEIGYQMLQNYAEEIKKWGWICNIHSQHTRSFKKNLNMLQKQQNIATLVAVPCILGVNLSDIDLLEFLQQLADTDGSSTTPPSVLRVLNFKACRGAIMFGDALLPSECALIVEELKQASLCFQCAHGRPTTVPLVNLVSLHKQIAKLEALNGRSSASWRGLRRHELNAARAARRLDLARGW